MSLIKWIDLPNLGDNRGGLVVAESNKTIPFDVKRVYYIYGVNALSSRGFHAHKQLEQVAVCVSGKCRMSLDNGKEKVDIYLESPNKAVRIEKMIWHEMHDFSDDCVLLVFASELYNEFDYIRDYHKFLTSELK